MATSTRIQTTWLETPASLRIHGDTPVNQRPALIRFWLWRCNYGSDSVYRHSGGWKIQLLPRKVLPYSHPHQRRYAQDPPPGGVAHPGMSRRKDPVRSGQDESHALPPRGVHRPGKGRRLQGLGLLLSIG